MQVNGEAIYGTRPWKIFGEGPATDSGAPISAQGFNEGKGKPFGAEDIRFTVKGKTLYATILGWPAGNETLVKNLKTGDQTGTINKVSLLGNGNLNFEQTSTGLKVKLPEQAPGKDAFVLKIAGAI